MKENLLKTMLSAAMTVFAISTAMAQHAPESKDVVPASKGNLPTDIPVIAQAEEGHAGCLQLDQVTYWTGWSERIEAWLTMPYPNEFGCEYFTLQFRTTADGEWSNYNDDHFEYANATPQMTASTYYRVIAHGGDKDGYISNEVFVEYPIVNHCHIKSWSSSGAFDFQTTGSKIRAGTVVIYKYYDPNPDKTEDGYALEYKTYTEQDGCFRYQWYRRNPNTGEMTAIEGATDREYVITAEDVSYEIVELIKGDDRTLSFTKAFNHGVIRLPIPSSIAYLDNSGFMLNTEYVIPDPKNIVLSNWSEDDGIEVSQPLGDAIKEVKPGQYWVTMDRKKYDYGTLTYGKAPFYLSFIYMMPVWNDDGEVEGYAENYREAQVMADRYLRPLMLKNLCGEEVVNSTFDVLGIGKDGKFGIVASQTTEQHQDEGLELFKGKYYVKLRKTSTTLETYYPNALTWTDAEYVEPQAYDGSEEWHCTVAMIEVQPGFEPLTGSSTIKGTISINGNSARSRARMTRQSEGADVVYTVNLKDNGTGSIIAQTETDGSGYYEFNNVPIGNYTVVPNIDGYKASAGDGSATVTSGNETVNVNCTVKEVSLFEIFPEELPEGVTPGDADANGKIDTKDITEVVNAIMGKPSAAYNQENADANRDKKVNAADIVSIQNIISANKQTAPAKADLIGSWEMASPQDVTLSFTESLITQTHRGTVRYEVPYTFENGILTYTTPPPFEDMEPFTETYNVSMPYDKSVLALKFTTGDETESVHLYLNKVKQPDTSDTKLDGKWFCYQYGKVQYGLWIDGDKAEFIMGSEATRMVGTYTYSSGILTLNPTAYYSGRGEGEEAYGRINPTTLECSQWDPIENPGYLQSFAFIIDGNEAYSWYGTSPCLWYKQ